MRKKDGTILVSDESIQEPQEQMSDLICVADYSSNVRLAAVPLQKTPGLCRLVTSITTSGQFLPMNPGEKWEKETLSPVPNSGSLPKPCISTSGLLPKVSDSLYPQEMVKWWSLSENAAWGRCQHHNRRCICPSGNFHGRRTWHRTWCRSSVVPGHPSNGNPNIIGETWTWQWKIHHLYPFIVDLPIETSSSCVDFAIFSSRETCWIDDHSPI